MSDHNQDIDLTINWEVTRRLQKEEKYVKFNEWCVKYGVVAPSVEWPVAYGPKGDLIGVRATRDIGLMESYLYVPCKISINEDQFKRSWIGEIYENEVGNFESRDDCEHIMLMFFVAYQMTLGKKSFWYLYFQVAADSDLPMNWGAGDLAFLGDEAL